MSDQDPNSNALSRRHLLTMIGKMAGGTAMYHAMTALGHAAESQYTGPIKLEGAPKGTTLLVLGAGMAGLVAAYEMRKAGYKVKLLEYNTRAGGRSWTLRGGDTFTELGGATQKVEFDKGQYINPGPWRLPYNHNGMLDYAHRLNVPLEPFIQVNYQAYIHSKNAYGGKPQRFREVQADFNGNIAELLNKAVAKGSLDDAVTHEDKDKLVETLRRWGGLDKAGKYGATHESATRRGWDIPPGGGLAPAPKPSQPMDFSTLVKSGLANYLAVGHDTEFQTAIFQPKGGMDQVAMAVYREVKDLVQFGAKVTAIDQDDKGVTVTYTDVKSGSTQTAKADYCVCAIPLSILSQIDIKVSDKMHAAIEAVPYEAAVKIGLQFKRRFWEQDDLIYGGITYTDLPIVNIGYPMYDFGSRGKGTLLGAYIWGPNAYEFTARSPAERIRLALEYGSQIHPQYKKEFETGVAVGWHRVPFINGCFGNWSDENRAKHYENLCQIDGRIVLAGEHASLIPAWQEGAVESSLNAIGRLHALIKSKAA